MIDKKQIAHFQKEILEWFVKNKRDLPWRRPSLPTSPRLRGSRKLRNGLRDPYAILVSEVMLQQTQVGRVIPKFEAWMKKFPTVGHLAHASIRDVLSMWSGLGYNRRALYLKKLAEEVVKNHNGIFSQEEKVLLLLPGIGQYTARAILCFAYDKQLAVVDTNVRKVILTRFGKYVTDTPKDIQAFADMLLPKGKAYEWNQALMDYASANLKKVKIAIPRQSKFANSDRYYRGEIIRLLLKNHTQSFLDVEKHFQAIKKPLLNERLEKILQSLVKDAFIRYENKKIQFISEDGE